MKVQHYTLEVCPLACGLINFVYGHGLRHCLRKVDICNAVVVLNRSWSQWIIDQSSFCCQLKTTTDGGLRIPFLQPCQSVGITALCRGEHMLWVYAVDDIVYSVGHKSAYIPWVICCGQHRYMMWVTWLSTLYIHVIHIIYPRYMIVYTVGRIFDKGGKGRSDRPDHRVSVQATPGTNAGTNETSTLFTAERYQLAVGVRMCHCGRVLQTTQGPHHIVHII